MTTREKLRILGLCVVLTLIIGFMVQPSPTVDPGPAVGAQTATAADEGTEAPRAKEVSLWGTIKAGGLIGFIIILMSMGSVGLIVEHFLSITRDKLIPDALEAELHGMLEDEEYEEAQEVCAADGSFLAEVVGAGLTQVGSMFGYFDMEKAMQEVSEREVSRLYRKIEYLSFIASTAPMMGLLGTVTGMISAFNEIAASEGSADPAQLAGGISMALVTTCMGLVVAIPTMFFVSFFRNRIDAIVAEAGAVVERLMGRFRQGAQ